MFFFFKQQTAYAVRISDWSSDVCSSDLLVTGGAVEPCAVDACDRTVSVSDRSDQFRKCGRCSGRVILIGAIPAGRVKTQPAFGANIDNAPKAQIGFCQRAPDRSGSREQTACGPARSTRSEEHTSELQSLMRISYAVFCLKKKKTNTQLTTKRRHRRTHIS